MSTTFYFISVYPWEEFGSTFLACSHEVVAAIHRLLFEAEQTQFYQSPFMCEVFHFPLPPTGLAHGCQCHRNDGMLQDMVSQMANTEEESLPHTCWLLPCLGRLTYVWPFLLQGHSWLGYSLLSTRIPMSCVAELLSIRLCPVGACWMRLFHPE